MDEFLGDSAGKSRTISITDSTMMRIVHSAMNKAHERVKSREGAFERLNEMSKFYESAVMQLEGCMEFVRDETAAAANGHGEEEAAVLAGLSEIRDRLRNRLAESDHAIAHKDRELAERAESESRLRRALEAKERELASLEARLAGGGRSSGEFREIKNSVDERVEQMGSDLDALRETLDVAFARMRTAMLSPQVGRRSPGAAAAAAGFDAFRRGLAGELEALKSELSSLFVKENRDSFVAKMVKSHESIIRQKSAEAEELSWLRREVSRERAVSSGRREKEEPLSPKKRVRRVVAKLDSLMKLCEISGDCPKDSNEIVFDSLEQAWERVNNNNCYNTVSRDKILSLEQGLEDSNLEKRLMEEIYVILFQGLFQQFNYELCKCDDPRVENNGLNGSEYSDKEIEGEIREDIERLMFREILKDWNKRIEVSNTDSVVGEQICQTVFGETIKSIVEAKLQEVDECNRASLIKEEIFQFVALEALKDAFFRLKAEELESGSAAMRKMDKSVTKKLAARKEKLDIVFAKSSIGNLNLNEMKRSHGSDSVLATIPEFFGVVADFERVIGDKLKLNILRLEEIKHNLNPLVGIVSSLREKETLYRKGFIRRCQNLLKAEIEVDLLGDQVEVLLGVLQKIHKSLQLFSPVEHQNVWVPELLQMIKKELTGVFHIQME